jgi:ABC-type glycerol-3-phosphate transport system permease component
VAGGPIMAMSLVSILPIVAIFFALQKYFVQGIALTGMKE